jgi:hypothetical protein
MTMALEMFEDPEDRVGHSIALRQKALGSNRYSHVFQL